MYKLTFTNVEGPCRPAFKTINEAVRTGQRYGFEFHVTDFEDGVMVASWSTSRGLERHYGNPFSCSGCSRLDGNASSADANGVFTCQGCGGLLTSRAIYAGESYGYVLPQLGDDPDQDNARYFDFTVLGGNGKVNRRHGWFDPSTKLMTQAG